MKSFLSTLLLGVGCASTAFTQPLTSTQIDTLVQRTLTTFDVPGIAVAVIKDGKVVHMKGYGLRSLKTRQPVDENTIFSIASNSKAFTAAALGILVDEGKITWDDRVIKYIPEFQLYNPYVTEEFTIRDLLTHRSGLGLGAGDLTIVLDSTDFTVKDVIQVFRYLKPVSGFRTKFDYDNLLYIVAGEVVERVSGQSWPEFVEERIMKPLHMNRSKGARYRFADNTNVIDTHAPVNGRIQVTSRQYNHQMHAAGGINSSVADMSKWVIAQLNKGKYGPDSGKRIFSEKTHIEMWSPQTIMPANPTPVPPYNTHFSAYGLGWRLSDVKGYKQVTHNGGLPGVYTHVLLLPELKVGLLVFTNQQSGAAINAISNTIKDSYLRVPASDWISTFRRQEKKEQAEADSITKAVWTTITDVQKKNTTRVDLARYVGSYRDPWFGEVVLSQQSGNMTFRSVRSPKLTGEVFAYKDNTFVVKWNDRSLDADVYLTFTLDDRQKPKAIKLKPISPLTDFSFDFQDLNLQRIN